MTRAKNSSDFAYRPEPASPAIMRPSAHYRNARLGAARSAGTTLIALAALTLLLVGCASTQGRPAGEVAVSVTAVNVAPCPVRVHVRQLGLTLTTIPVSVNTTQWVRLRDEWAVVQYVVETDAVACGHAARYVVGELRPALRYVTVVIGATRQASSIGAR